MAVGGIGTRPLPSAIATAMGLVRLFASPFRALRRKPLGLVSLVLLVLMVVATVFAPWVAPYGIDEATDRYAESPSLQNWFGTDHLGRDVLSRVLYGGRVSLLVGFASVVLGLGVGVIFGVLSGYVGGWPDILLQRLVDIFMAVPNILLALTLVASFGAGIGNVTLAIAVGIAPRAARIVRGSTLAVRELPYIEAAESLGMSSVRLMLRHVLPNIMAPIIVIASIQLGVAVIVEASLSFLGLGVPLNVPTWGNMLSGAGLRFMIRAPWMAIAPGIALTLVVVALNLLGDSLRDILDPRLRGSGGRAS
jgi:peptide/nickel transport system permease protein